MIAVLVIFVILTWLLLVGFGVLAFLAWKKVEVFLTWNTRYESLEYEQAVTQPKLKKPSAPASKTEHRGRAIVSVDDLVDLNDLDFETAANAVEALGE